MSGPLTFWYIPTLPIFSVIVATLLSICILWHTPPGPLATRVCAVSSCTLISYCAFIPWLNAARSIAYATACLSAAVSVFAGAPGSPMPSPFAEPSLFLVLPPPLYLVALSAIGIATPTVACPVFGLPCVRHGVFSFEYSRVLCDMKCHWLDDCSNRTPMTASMERLRFIVSQ